MGFFLHRNLSPEGELDIWEIEEPEDWFQEQLHLTPVELQQIDAIKGDGRRLEWLAGRYLLHLMSGREERVVCLTDQYGKPYLENSRFQISISHSHYKVAVIAAPLAVGVDIQKFVPKIERLAHKYMRSDELESLEAATRLEHLHVYWGAKESLYKAYGRRSLDLKEHIRIEPFSYNSETGQFHGTVVKEDYRAHYQLWYEKIGEFMLVYAIEVIS